MSKKRRVWGDLKGEGRTHISLFVAERLSTMVCGLAGECAAGKHPAEH